MATVKKPIVLYGGLMKQIQPGDTTPGQEDASIAQSFAKEKTTDNSIAASNANAHASVAESVARQLDLTGTASEALSVAQVAESIGDWGVGRASEATSMSMRASSLARNAVEISDISEAASVGRYGVSVGSRAESLAREVESDQAASLDSYSEAISTQSVAAHSYTSSVESVADKAEIDAADGQSIGTRGESLARAEGSEADLGISSASSLGTRAQSLARAEGSEATLHTNTEITNLSTAVASDVTMLSEAVGGGVDELSEGVKSEANLFSVATSESFRSDSVATSFAISDARSFNSEGVSQAKSMASYGHSVAIDAESVADMGVSIAENVGAALTTYSIDFGLGREGHFVYMTGTSGKVALANASDEGKMPAIGIIMQDLENEVKVRMLPDQYTDIKLDSNASPIVGANLFISDVETGKISNLAPSIGVAQRVGVAESAPSVANVDVNFRLGEPIVL